MPKVTTTRKTYIRTVKVTVVTCSKCPHMRCYEYTDPVCTFKLLNYRRLDIDIYKTYPKWCSLEDLKPKPSPVFKQKAESNQKAQERCLGKLVN